MFVAPNVDGLHRDIEISTIKGVPIKAILEGRQIYVLNDTDFQPVGIKTAGCALGAIYLLEGSEKSWIGKIGTLKDTQLIDRKATKKAANELTIQEKIAYDLYDTFSQNTFYTPQTYLSRQPLLDKYTELRIEQYRHLGDHSYVLEWDRAEIHKTLRIMTEFVEGYQDFSKAKTQVENETLSFIDFFKRFHRPPETILTPENKSVPLLGLMELIATARILADTDCLGGSLDNAGWVWERDDQGQIIAGKAVKIDPGESFQLTCTELDPGINRLLGTVHHRAVLAWQLADLKDIQVANMNRSITILWKDLTEAQQKQFHDHLLTFMKELLESEDDRLFCFFRDKGFHYKNSKTAKMPLKVAQDLAEKLREWLELQSQVYEEGLEMRKVFFNYPAPLTHFVDREEELVLLKEALVPNLFSPETTSAFRMISGVEGIGKSELASYFAYKERRAFDLIYWIPSGNRDTLLHSYLSLAEILNVDIEDKSNLEAVVSSVNRALETRNSDRPFLLIFDNAEAPLALPKQGGSILVTTRAENLGEKEQVISLKPFSPEVSYNYIKQRTAEPQSEAMDHLIAKVGGNPLILTQATAFMQQEKMTANEYIQEVDLEDPTKIWYSTLERIQKKNPLALKWLSICAFLQPDSIPQEWLESWLEIQGFSPENIHNMATQIHFLLKNYVLTQLDYQQERISLHRLLQEALLTFVDPEEINQRAQEAIELLYSQSKNLDPTDANTWEKTRTWLIHAKSCLSHNLDVSSEKAASVLGLTGSFLLSFGQYEEAFSYVKRAFEMRNQLFQGQPHLDIVNSLSNMEICLSKLGRHSKALEYSNKARAMTKLLYSDESKIGKGIGHIKNELEKKLSGSRESIKNSNSAVKIPEKERNCLLQ